MGNRQYPEGFVAWLDGYYADWRSGMLLARVEELEACWLASAQSRDGWFRAVCSEEMGVDAPGGDACHPLRDWLKAFKELSGAKQAASTAELLKELAQRGGAAAALGKAGLLFEAKGQDYNVGISRDDYFPLGLSSYAQMVWVKALRLVSFAKTPRAPRHEDISETLLDCINYCAFAWDWMQRQRLTIGGASSIKAEERRA